MVVGDRLERPRPDPPYTMHDLGLVSLAARGVRGLCILRTEIPEAGDDAMSDDAANNRLAARMMRGDIHRILARWDPMCLKGLRDSGRAYEEYVNDLYPMIKKGAEKMEVARKLAELMRDKMRLPADNAKCIEVAGRLHSIGAHYRGES